VLSRTNQQEAAESRQMHASVNSSVNHQHTSVHHHDMPTYIINSIGDGGRLTAQNLRLSLKRAETLHNTRIKPLLNPAGS